MSQRLIKRIEAVDFLISARKTGTPTSFARRLNISERALYRLLEEMKELGAPISYCKLRRSYYYTEEGRFYAGFKKSVSPVRSYATELPVISQEPVFYESMA
ncbi:HTH domain-containing protein [Pedobacter sp. HMF7647]|uniref:HTH domain-containing protein n=1 Tax=Hufsiella arboris TaxID=2695275 RepID=A0A7K1Y742_9SPHI|nr:HTH domain-containing protein [Hufsiella arboris]MXV50387.1 HTH domain-containing protein [Hufsiella arboris]